MAFLSSSTGEKLPIEGIVEAHNTEVRRYLLQIVRREDGSMGIMGDAEMIKKLSTELHRQPGIEGTEIKFVPSRGHDGTAVLSLDATTMGDNFRTLKIALDKVRAEMMPTGQRL